MKMMRNKNGCGFISRTNVSETTVPQLGPAPSVLICLRKPAPVYCKRRLHHGLCRGGLLFLQARLPGNSTNNIVAVF